MNQANIYFGMDAILSSREVAGHSRRTQNSILAQNKEQGFRAISARELINSMKTLRSEPGAEAAAAIERYMDTRGEVRSFVQAMEMMVKIVTGNRVKVEQLEGYSKLNDSFSPLEDRVGEKRTCSVGGPNSMSFQSFQVKYEFYRIRIISRGVFKTVASNTYFSLQLVLKTKDIMTQAGAVQMGTPSPFTLQCGFDMANQEMIKFCFSCCCNSTDGDQEDNNTGMWKRDDRQERLIENQYKIERKDQLAIESADDGQAENRPEKELSELSVRLWDWQKE